MDKKIFNNVAYMITKELQRNSLSELCNYYGCTIDEFYEFVDDLALIGFKDKYNLTTVYPETHRDAREYKDLFDMMSTLYNEVESVYEIVKRTYYIAKEERDFNANAMLQDFMGKLTEVISQVITLRDKAEKMPTDYDTYDFHIKDWGIVGVEL